MCHIDKNCVATTAILGNPKIQIGHGIKEYVPRIDIYNSLSSINGKSYF